MRGSGKAVKLQQHDALDALESAARNDEAERAPPNARATFAGLARHELLQRAAWVVLPAASQKLKRLREDTQKLIAEKTEGGHWAGFGKTLPLLRRRPGSSDQRMIVRQGLAAPHAVRILRERALRLQGKGRPKPGEERPKPTPVTVINLLEDETDLDVVAGRPVKYRRVTQADLDAATCVKVQSGSDLLLGEADNHILRGWLSVIALGKQVRTKDSQEIDFKPALQSSQTLSFSDKFDKKHASLVSMYQCYAARNGSAWKVLDASTTSTKKTALDVTHVDTMSDFRQWLISAHRFSTWAGVGVEGVDDRGGISRYGRETVSVA